MRTLIRLLLVTVVLGGCSFGQDKDRGERAVARFHQLFASSEYSQMYADTTDGFREAATEADFVEFMSAVRRKLGDVRSFEQTGLEVTWDGQGTSIWLSYNTAYELGTATEQFVWIVEGETVRLDAYKIDSKDLILR